MEDSVVDRNMQREIRDKANKSMAILGKGLEQHMIKLESFNMLHKRINRYDLWDLFTDEELVKYNPQNILDKIHGMNHVDTRIILDDTIKFYDSIWLDVEGPYSSIIKRKNVLRNNSYRASIN